MSARPRELVLLLAGLALAGCHSESDLRLVLVTTSASNPSPEQTIDVALVLANDTNDTLQIVSADLSLASEHTGFRYVMDAASTTELAPNSQTNIRLQATLPRSFDSLTIDGEVVAVNHDKGLSLRAQGAETPLVIEPGGGLVSETDLIVSTLDDELDGTAGIEGAGGAGDLSLREAIAIANRRPGPDLIQFQADLFASEEMGAIPMDPLLGSLLVTDAGTTIDGGGHSVVLLGQRQAGPTLKVNANQFSMFNIIIRDFLYYGISLQNAGSATIRDCTFEFSDDYCSGSVIRVDTSPGLRLSNNLMIEGYRMVHISNSDNARVTDNELDSPETGIIVDSSSDVELKGNSIHTNYTGISLLNTVGVSVEANLFLGAGSSCLAIEEGSTATMVLDNQLDNCADRGTPYAAIRIIDLSQSNTLSRNVIVNSGNYLISVEAGSNGDAPAPTISAVSPQEVSGTASQAPGSVIEIYADPGDQAGLYVGTTTVQTDGSWSVAPTVTLTPGMSVRATATGPGGNTSPLCGLVAVP